VIRFRWKNPHTLQTEEGVFKVQKPGIARNFESELQILNGLARHLSSHDRKHVLSEVDLPNLLSDVKTHLKMELDVRHEQKNLLAAQRRLGRVKGIRVPELIEELCTPTITAMTFEEGCKVTEAYKASPWRKTDLTVKVVEHLIANPLM
jgi:ubiquinone biosynthesis protein